MSYRDTVQQLVRAYQYRLHPLALRRLTDYLGDTHADEFDAQRVVREVFQQLQVRGMPDRFVDAKAMEAVVQEHAGQTRRAREREGAAVVQVVSLEDIPAVALNDATDELNVVPDRALSDRLSALRERYLQARRRCRRSGLYRAEDKPHAFAPATADDEVNSVPLVTIASLEGLEAWRKVAVLGFLVCREDKMYLEDMHGVITLNIDRNTTVVDARNFICAGFLVVVSGRWCNGVLNVTSLDLPPCERREYSLHDARHSIDCFGLAPRDYAAAIATEKNALQSVVVVLSHVHLDKASTLTRLSQLLQKMQERSERELAETTFVLVGNFSSVPLRQADACHLPDAASTSASPLRGLLDELARCVVSNAPTAALHSHFILIPGPEDGSALQGVFPQPPFPRYLTRGLKGRLKTLSLAPNPCRLRFCTREVVVVRRDYLRLLQAGETALQPYLPTTAQHQATLPRDECTSFERVTKTLLDEAHLVPDPGTTILWRKDDALRLATLPQTLIVCDSTEPWECYYKDVHVVNPGSFSVSATFLWYTPIDAECSLSTMQPSS